MLRSSDDDTTEVGSPTSARKTQFPPDFPTKPLSPTEERQKNGFFPINWRVIGGGVPLGGRSKRLIRKLLYSQSNSRDVKGALCKAYRSGQCDKGDDCPFSHDVDSDDSGQCKSTGLCANLKCHITLASQLSDLGHNGGEWGDSMPSSPPGSVRSHASLTSAGSSARTKSRPSSMTLLPAREFYASEGHLNSAPATAVPSPLGSRYSSRQNLEEENTPSHESSGHRRTRSMVSSPGSSRLTQGDVSICRTNLSPH